MANLDEKIALEKLSARHSISSTTYTFDRTTLFSDDATIRADDSSPSYSRSRSGRLSTLTRFSSTTAIPNAFALSRTCSPASVVKSNHNSIMGAISGFAISRAGRFLRYLGLKSVRIKQHNVFRNWIKELDGLLNAQPEELLKSQQGLADTLDDLLTITTNASENKGKSNAKEQEIVHSLILRTIDTEWLARLTKYSFNTGQHGCLVVIIDYLCRLYQTQVDQVIWQKILLGIFDCSSTLLVISASFAPQFLKENALTLFCETVSQTPELFVVENEPGLHRDSLLLKFSSILHRCGLTGAFVAICGEDRLSRLLETVSGDEYCTLSKEFVIVASFAGFAKYSPAIQKRLPSLASVPMFIHILQISTLQMYGKSVSWDVLLEVESLQDKICEAASMLLRTLFQPKDYLWAKDDMFLGNASRLITNEKFRNRFIESGAVSSVLTSLDPLQGRTIPLEAPPQPKRAVASLLMLLKRLDPNVMQALADRWFRGERITQEDSIATTDSLLVFCWATTLFAVSVEFYPELAEYPDSCNAVQQLVDGFRACSSPMASETYMLALEQCWESAYGRQILKAMGLTEYDVLIGLHDTKKANAISPSPYA